MVLLRSHHLVGKNTGPNPTDRSKSGTKRSLLVDGKGVPLGVVVDGANRHDMKMTKATLQSIVIDRPEPTVKSQQHMCRSEERRVGKESRNRTEKERVKKNKR